MDNIIVSDNIKDEVVARKTRDDSIRKDFEAVQYLNKKAFNNYAKAMQLMGMYDRYLKYV